MPDSLLQTLINRAREMVHNGEESIVAKLGSIPRVADLLKSDSFEPDLDRPYLKQYFHPERDILSPQSLRPTQLSNIPNVPFRRFGDIESPEKYDIVQRPRKDGSLEPPTTSELRNKLGMLEWGMGHNTKSIGVDNNGQPYLSIYDLWDFDSPVLGNLAQALLKRTGQPYAIYDRYPIERSWEEPNKTVHYKFKK